MNISKINALIEALQEKVPVNKVFIAAGKRDRRTDRVIELCRQNGTAYQVVPVQTIARKAGANHQGIFAEISPVRFYGLEEILETARTGLILILDGINDTGNMGAIIRSAVAADVDGIIIPLRNSAPINDTVLKTSAGSLVKARLVQSKNLSRDIERLKENNFWVVGTAVDPVVSIAYYDYDFTANTAVIMGGEHKGVSPLLKKNADQLVYIPHSGKIESLNVSAASAVILFEALRQKKSKT
jgi:23S rRNA (guanosine2251-2'-O)-methyltransferase